MRQSYFFANTPRKTLLLASERAFCLVMGFLEKDKVDSYLKFATSLLKASE